MYRFQQYVRYFIYPPNFFFFLQSGHSTMIDRRPRFYRSAIHHLPPAAMVRVLPTDIATPPAISKLSIAWSWLPAFL